MQAGGPELLIVFLAGIVPFILGVAALYVVIRFGVKHGMASYYKGTTQRPDDGV